MQPWDGVTRFLLVVVVIALGGMTYYATGIRDEIVAYKDANALLRRDYGALVTQYNQVTKMLETSRVRLETLEQEMAQLRANRTVASGPSRTGRR